MSKLEKPMDYACRVERGAELRDGLRGCVRSTDGVRSLGASVARLAAVLACALEVQARGGQRTARDHLLPLARGEAYRALSVLSIALSAHPPARAELRDMMIAVLHCYPRPWMALRVVALATEATCHG